MLSDSSKQIAQARRLDNEKYPAFGDLSERKAHTIKGSNQKWLLGCEEAKSYDKLYMVEGGPDFIAAHALINDSSTGVIGILGSFSEIDKRSLELVKGKRVRIFPHADNAGNNALKSWALQLSEIACVVDAFDLSGLEDDAGNAVGAHGPGEIEGRAGADGEQSRAGRLCRRHSWTA